MGVKRVKLMRGVEASRLSATPVQGEPIMTTDELKLYLGDGSKAGGFVVNADSTLAVWPDQSDATKKLSLAWWIAYFNGNEATIRIPRGTHEVLYDMTVPENICLKFDKGAILEVASGKTLIINGSIEAGLWQIFDGLGTFGGNPINKCLYVEWWGAIGNGIDDCGVATRKAIAIGEDKIIKFSGGTYLITTLSGIMGDRGDYAFILPSNITIDGNNKQATIKLGPAIYQTAVSTYGAGIFTATDKNNICIQNLIIDFNGINNIIPIGFFHTGYGVNFNGCNYTSIHDNIWKNSFGRNVILINGTGNSTTIPRCKGADIYNNEIINGGTSLTGNTEQNDFSAMYIEADGANIHHNKIISEQNPFTYYGGIELHGPNQICKDNYFKNCFPAIYLVNNIPNTVMNNVIISNNICENCCGGIWLSKGYTLNHIIISNNNIILQQNSSYVNPIMPAISTYILGGAYPYSDHRSELLNSIISNNIITGLVTDKSEGIRICAAVNCTVENNNISSMGYSGIEVWGSYYETKNLRIKGNTITDVGQQGLNDYRSYIAFMFHNSSTDPVLNGFTAHLIVENNIFSQTTSVVTYGFFCPWDIAKATITIEGGNNSRSENIRTYSGTSSAYNSFRHIFKMFSNNITDETGWVIDANGLITQWVKGTTPATPGETLIVYLPFLFRSRCVFAIPYAGPNVGITITAKYTAQIRITSDTANAPFNILAIGY